MACGANSGVKVTIRSYIFDVADYLTFLFGHEAKAWSLLEPFLNWNEKLFSLENPVTGLSGRHEKMFIICPSRWMT
jgi:hypothetical protein